MEKAPDAPTGALCELKRLLMKHPCVSIRADSSGVCVRESRGWAGKNWDDARRISDLVYLTPGVFQWLEDQPRDVIDGRYMAEVVR